jgi:hypothetical protein
MQRGGSNRGISSKPLRLLQTIAQTMNKLTKQ